MATLLAALSVAFPAFGQDLNIAPIRKISGVNTGLDRPTYIAIRNGELFVSNYVGDTIGVFDLKADGDVAPKRTLSKANLRPHGIAFDASGNLYVSRFDLFKKSGVNPNQVGAVDVYGSAAVAAGGALAEPPDRNRIGTDTGTSTHFYGPSQIALDGDGYLFVANANAISGQSAAYLSVFAPGATGDAAPIRRLAIPVYSSGGICTNGNGIGLYGLAISGDDVFVASYNTQDALRGRCDRVAVYSKADLLNSAISVPTAKRILESNSNSRFHVPRGISVSGGQLYLASEKPGLNGAYNVGVKIYDASGPWDANTKPLQTIQGSLTQLADGNCAVTCNGPFHVEVDGASGEIFVSHYALNTITVYKVIGPVSGSVSTVAASPASVVADGTTTSTVTVTLTDAYENPMSGKTVTLSQGAGSSTISAASGPSDAAGVVTFTVSNAKVEVVTYSAIGDGVSITQTAQVDFTPNAYTVGGTLSGLGTGKSVVLQNNTNDDLTVSANGSFTFATAVNAGGAYDVSVKTQPVGQLCSVADGSGSNISANIANVAVSCITLSAAGACGTAANSANNASAPAAGLCGAGNVSSPVRSITGGYSWSCRGELSGPAALCTAWSAAAPQFSPSGTRFELLDDAGCKIDKVALVPAPNGGPTEGGPWSMPYGVLDFELVECIGDTVRVKMTFPETIASGVAWKYGPKDVVNAPNVLEWYQLPGAISDKSIILTIRDNGLGDSDPRRGVIVDPAGPAFLSGAAPGVTPTVEQIPTLSEWAMMLLAAFLGLFAASRLRQRPA